MAVDVVTEIEIARPSGLVGAFAADPDNASTWHKNIERVEWRTPPRSPSDADRRSQRAFSGAR